MSTAAVKTQVNPYSSTYSSYAELRDRHLVHLASSGQKITGEALEAHDAFLQRVTNADFPGVGAKAPLNGNFYRYGFYDEVNSHAATLGLAHDLWQYANDQASFEINYATFIASFRSPIVMDEAEWKTLLWNQLQSLHEIDLSDWDATVSIDPAQANFSFSFAGVGFFIVGLHLGASRLARQFPWPIIVFNVHERIERLREEGLFQKLMRANS
jgi:FPC/CPF motif-containing protein YcgG